MQDLHWSISTGGPQVSLRRFFFRGHFACFVVASLPILEVNIIGIHDNVQCHTRVQFAVHKPMLLNSNFGGKIPIVLRLLQRKVNPNH